MPKIEMRNLALALVQVVQMWSNPRYKSFLLAATPGELKEDWFRWFVGSWNVARTIKDGKQTRVREYLDQDFRRALVAGGGAETIDAAALHIQQVGWSSKGCVPVSLVSKVAFFLRPAQFVPMDSYAVEGLNLLRQSGSTRRLKGKSYAEYLNAFNEHYSKMEARLESALKQRWVAGLAAELGCPPGALTTAAMRRKLFDDYLMHSAEYRK